MRNAGLEEAQAGIKITGRNINNLRNADDTTFMADNEEKLKSLLMKLKGESERDGAVEIRVVSSAYLRLLIFLLAILIPACASSSPVFLMMYFAYIS